MTARKIVLLSSIAVLSAILALQILLGGPAAAKTLTLKESPDGIKITAPSGTEVLLSKRNDRWTVGTASYPADPGLISSLAESLSNLKVLGTVSASGAEERFGLDEASALSVELTAGGKTLRKLKVGKASPTGQQSYATVDGAKEVVLVSGNLGESLGKGEGDFRDKNVYAFGADTLIGVSVQGDESYSLVKAGDPAVWKAVTPSGGADTEMDAEKAGSWVSSLASLRAQSFLSDDLTVPATALAAVNLDFGSRKVRVEVLEKRGDSEYLMRCSESPSPFTVSSYTAEKYLKKLSELAK